MCYVEPNQKKHGQISYTPTFSTSALQRRVILAAGTVGYCWFHFTGRVQPLRQISIDYWGPGIGKSEQRTWDHPFTRLKRSGGRENMGVWVVPWSCTVFGDCFTGSCLLESHQAFTLSSFNYCWRAVKLLVEAQYIRLHQYIYTSRLNTLRYEYLQISHDFSTWGSIHLNSLSVSLAVTQFIPQVPAQSKRPSVDPRRDGALACRRFQFLASWRICDVLILKNLLLETW